MKTLFPLLLFCMLALSTSATNVSGTIAVNTTWNLAGSPYIITGDITVNNGVTLTVQSSVIVQFNSGRVLFVNGVLNATSATFTSSAVTPARGDWDYIRVGNGTNAATATFTSCNISWGQEIYVSNNGTLNLTSTTVADFLNQSVEIASGGIANLNSAIISGNDNYGIHLTGNSAKAKLTSSNITGCEWPVYYSAPGRMTTSGVCNLTGNTRDACYITFSSLSDSLILPTVNVPYLFYSSFTINVVGVMIVKDNNILKSSSVIEVNGVLKADATVGNTISFTSYLDDNLGGDTNDDGAATAPASQNWQGIKFNPSSIDAHCVMRRCLVRYSGSGSEGAVDADNANPTIDNCEFQLNYFGVTFRNGSDAVFSNNTIGSSEQTPVAMMIDCNPVFTNNSFSFSDNAYDALGIFATTLSRTTTLVKRNVTGIPNITYVMLGDITIPSGDTLTIEQGIVIKPVSYYYIYVQGRLVANGSVSEKITFTSIKDDNHGNPGDTNKNGNATTPAVGDWRGIVFAPGSTGLLNHCRFYYGELSGLFFNSYHTSGQIAVISSSPVISNCEIKDVQIAVSSYNTASPQISNTAIINTSSVPFGMSASTNPSFTNITFTNIGTIAMGIFGETISNNGVIKRRNLSGYNNITYLLLGELTVAAGAYLEVDSGIVIKSSTRINVNGGFRTNGTATAKVIFTSEQDDLYGNPFDTNNDGNATSAASGNWYGIELNSSSDDAYCKLKHTLLKYGGGAGRGSIRMTDAASVIENTVISNSYFDAIAFDGSSTGSMNTVTIEFCDYPIAVSIEANPTFTNITFTGNDYNGLAILNDNLSSNELLEKKNVAGFTNIPYILRTPLTIGTSGKLRFETGVIIKSRIDNINRNITVNGGFKAIGTALQRITFTSIKDDSAGGDTNNDGNTTVPNTYDIGGIFFNENAIDTACKMQYVTMRYVSGYAPFGGYNSAVTIYNSNPLIDNCIIELGNTSSAFLIRGNAAPVITNNQLLNLSYHPVIMSMFANPTFSGNTMVNVGRLSIGILAETWSQNATVPQRNFGGYTNITYQMLYFGTYDMTINSGTTITIPAGTVFKSDDETRFLVNGKLIVQGTAINPVVFTSGEDDAYGNPPDTYQNGATTPSISGDRWIEFPNIGNDTSVINYAIFRYRTKGIELNSASPTISNCTFSKCTYGIELSGDAAPVITNCTFNDLTWTPLITTILTWPASQSGNVISGTTIKAARLINETLSQDFTLPKRSFASITNIPYLLNSYTIGTNATLTINPGVVIKFEDYGSLTVNKGLIAVGGSTPDSNIVFTHYKDDFYGGDTDANGSFTTPSVYFISVSFTSTSLAPLSRMKRCIFRFGGNSSYQEGAIDIANASPSIQYCLFDNCNNAVKMTLNSNPTINYCDFTNIDNSYFAVNNVNPTFTVNAENCWWGANTGPTHSGNPSGTGEKSSNGVDYTPWRTTGTNNPLAGDVSLNGIVQAYDASLILQHAVTPFLNAAQLKVADVSAATGVTAFDASLVLQYLVGIINTFPSEVNKTGPDIPEVSDVVLAMNKQWADEGALVTVPLTISNVQNLAAMDITLRYDTSVLSLQELVVLDSMFSRNVDFTTYPGEIRIAMAGTQLKQQDETIALLTFKIAEPVSYTHLTLPTNREV